MASKELIFDLAKLDFEQPIADLEEIRRYNPQRFEMEQLTAVVYGCTETNICIGYKDLTHDEFWCRGHMPSMPLMPGMMMLEAAAQLCSFFTQKHDLLGAKMVGFGGLEDIRFRDPVIPGDRLIILCELTKVRRNRMIVCRFQGVVRDSVVVEGQIKGIPLPVDMMKNVFEREGS